jgi:hypothetical protein
LATAFLTLAAPNPSKRGLELLAIEEPEKI